MICIKTEWKGVRFHCTSHCASTIRLETSHTANSAAFLDNVSSSVIVTQFSEARVISRYQLGWRKTISYRICEASASSSVWRLAKFGITGFLSSLRCDLTCRFLGISGVCGTVCVLFVECVKLCCLMDLSFPLFVFFLVFGVYRKLICQYYISFLSSHLMMKLFSSSVYFWLADSRLNITL